MAETKKRVVIDIKGFLMQKELDTGEKRTVTDVCDVHGLSLPTISNWKMEAPQVVKFIRDFCIENKCSFEDIVKEI